MTSRLRRTAALVATGAVLIVTAACSHDSAPPRALPTRLVPDTLGGLVFAREPKAEAVWSKGKLPKNALISSGQIWTIRDGTTIQGDLQLAVFKPSVDTTDLTDAYDVRCAKKPKSCSGHQALLGMNGTLGETGFRRLYVGDQRVYEKVLSDLRMYLWFPPRTQSYVLLVLRKAFTPRSSEALMRALIDFQYGRPPGPVPLPTPDVVVVPAPVVAPAATPASTKGTSS